MPLWNLPAHIQDKPWFVLRCPAGTESFLSTDSTGVGHQHFPEGVFRGEEVSRWRKIICKRNGTWCRTWDCSLPSCSISSGSRVALRAQQMISAGSLKFIKAILNQCDHLRLFSFCIGCMRKKAQPLDAGRGNTLSWAEAGELHQDWLPEEHNLCPLILPDQANGAVFPVNFQLGY